ncbi:MAG: hypothetical protein HYX83_02325 [Chloroflexi bacterium]|nr:hypothetical protein [Chloroflexota bacterium]
MSDLNFLFALTLSTATTFLALSVSVAVRFERPEKGRAYQFLVVAVLAYVAVFLIFLLNSSGGTQSTAASLPLINSLGQWGQILGGGIVAAVLTLVGREIIFWWRSPHIKITFEDGGIGYGRDGPDPPNSYWIRVKVTNSGRTVAKSCVGKIVEFRYDKEQIDRDPIRLHWIDTPWQVGAQLFDKVDLYREQSEFLDVILTVPNCSSQAYLFTGLEPEYESSPQRVPVLVSWKARIDRLPTNTNKIRIEVYGDNFRVVCKEYSITWKEEDPTKRKHTDVRLK